MRHAVTLRCRPHNRGLRALVPISLVALGACAQGKSAFAWTPPIGIPSPSFGINETVADSSYTYWVDNSGACSDSGSGTPTAPRCTIPKSLSAGARVQVRGGPYLYTADTTWTATGTQASPVYIRGPASPASRPVLTFGDETLLALSGTYLIVENLEMKSGTVSISASSHHVAVRHFYLHDNPTGHNPFLGNYGSDVVIYDCEIAYNGPIPTTKDFHGIQTYEGTRNIWVVDSHFHHNSGDGIQFCHTCIGTGNGPANVYIGRNRFHDDEENAIDIKETRGPVVISENEAYNYLPSGESNGDAIRLDDEGAQGELWVLNNRVHDSTIGINPQGTAGKSYILGNRIWNCTSAGIWLAGVTTTVVANNTIVNAPMGIRGGTDVRGNIVTKASTCHLCQDIVACSNNLVWQPGGTPIVEVSCPNLVQADPLMVMSGNEQTGLPTRSPAVDAGYAHSVYAYYQTTYGLDIRRDPAGMARPQGAAWDIGAFEANPVSLPSVSIGNASVTEP